MRIKCSVLTYTPISSFIVHQNLLKLLHFLMDISLMRAHTVWRQDSSRPRTKPGIFSHRSFVIRISKSQLQPRTKLLETNCKNIYVFLFICCASRRFFPSKKLVQFQMFFGSFPVVFFFSRKTNKVELIDARQHKIVRSSPARHREFIPFLALILLVLAMLAYYLGTTQRFTIQGKNPELILICSKEFFPREGWGRGTLIWKNFAFRKGLGLYSEVMLSLKKNFSCVKEYGMV